MQQEPKIQDVLNLLQTHHLQYSSIFNKLSSDISDLTGDVTELKVDVTSMKDDISDLKVDVTSMKDDISNLKVDVTDLKVDVTSMKDDISDLKGDVTSMKDDISNLKVDVTDLKVEVERQGSKIGYLYEAQIRSHVKKKKGLPFSKRYIVQNLYTLAKLAFPKKKNNPILSNATYSDIFYTEKHVGSLVKFIFQNRLYEASVELLLNSLFSIINEVDKNFVEEFKSNISALEKEKSVLKTFDMNTKYENICTTLKTLKNQLSNLTVNRKNKTKLSCLEAIKLLIDFFAKHTKEEKLSFLKNSNVGIYMFTSHFSKKLIFELELDCKGCIEINSFLNNSQIKVVEIKSGISCTTSRKQLELQLKTIALAHELILQDCYKTKFSISCIGIGIVNSDNLPPPNGSTFTIKYKFGDKGNLSESTIHLQTIFQNTDNF